MKATDKIDAARIDLLLGDLRLPGIKLIWAALAETADKEGWPAARFLAALAEQEMVERSRRRFERHLEEARLPPGKTLDAFDFAAVPMISKAQVQALAAGDDERVIELLGAWPGPLSMLLRTSEGVALGADSRATLGDALGILGAAYTRTSRFDWADEVLRLGIQWAQDGAAGARLFRRLAEAHVARNRHGERRAWSRHAPGPRRTCFSLPPGARSVCIEPTKRKNRLGSKGVAKGSIR